MGRRELLTCIGLAAGAVLLAASVQAAPLTPHPLGVAATAATTQAVQPAVTTSREVDRLKPQQVHWGHGHHYGWRHRHWGWHHRHWGWHHRHWHHWHHRHWHHHW